jgi:hypothetical protein
MGLSFDSFRIPPLDGSFYCRVFEPRSIFHLDYPVHRQRLKLGESGDILNDNFILVTVVHLNLIGGLIRSDPAKVNLPY